MSGIFLIIFLLVWGAVAVLLGSLLSRLIKRLTTNTQTGVPNGWQTPVKFLMIALVFFLPIADEIISYPRYYQMCQDAGKYEFAPGMDAKKVFGRYFRMEFENEKLIGLFPNYHQVTQDVRTLKSFTVKEMNVNLVDISTDEIILKSKIVVPVASFAAIPWNGERYTWLLHSCTTENEKSKKFIRALQLHQTYNFD